ncbi:hypothetical protein SORBI_3003G139100 [Sorghum bicolor]|uniref:Uncharacterized protein n=1 Tax=Sorghum bicolor TaxID=4558 RepID=A0A1B6Q322_SORBI|nr:hypothetical protein SORBI_3003G139100 [Sorghum bicolor]
MGEENPGPKKSTPVRSPPPGHNNHLFFIITVACHASAPIMAKASSITSFFSSFFPRRTQRLLTRLLHVASYLASSRRPHLLDLLIIIEIHPIIISAETIIPRGGADQ